jgi:D-inositol-3-phosphate glycosyltransferase
MAGTRLRVLYSFPHRLGAERICHTAWQQVAGLAEAGADVMVFAAANARPLPAGAVLRPTLARGRMRVPTRLLGRLRTCRLHDRIVARRLERLGRRVDVVHAWPLGSLRTLQTACRLGIPTVLERPNAHTAFAYRVVQEECRRLDVTLPPGHEHAHDPDVLAIEEAEYRLATRLLCPSDFVARTFLDEGFPPERLARHQYGFDDRVYYPRPGQPARGAGLTALFAGGCAPRKGLHHALDAWLASSASRYGRLLVAGGFVAGYAERLAPALSHPSVRVLGHRTDLPELMRTSDVLVLPSIEEGSALVTSEARGSGCVLLVSDASGAVCRHMDNALVHRAGDVAALTRHFDRLDGDRALLASLRAASLRTVGDITWKAAAARLLGAYAEAIAAYRQAA